jgi:hypothetical protein
LKYWTLADQTAKLSYHDPSLKASLYASVMGEEDGFPGDNLSHVQKLEADLQSYKSKVKMMERKESN